jgi:hypothetical protein
MNWAELTDLDGKTIYVNLDQVVSIEPSDWANGVGAALRTTLVNENGKPRVIYVQDTAEVVYAWTSASSKSR